MSSIIPFSIFLPFQKILSPTFSHILPLKKNRLPTVARVLSATMADSTGKIETLGLIFSPETEAQGVHSYCKGSLILNALSYSSIKKRIDFLP